MFGGKKEKFQKELRRRYALRFHMTVILLATLFSGILISKLLLVLKVNNFALRYGATVVLSYLVFFLCVKLWLLYVSSKRTDRSSAVDWLPGPSLSSGGSPGESASPLRGGGGLFSGAGASASFDPVVPIAVGDSASTVAEGASVGTGVIGDAVDGATDALGDKAGLTGIVVLVVLAVVVAVILGGAIYVIFEAPMILSEAAFEGLLAASLVKKTRLIDDEDWMGSVFRATWIPFAATLAVAVFGALALHHYFPEAHRLADILKRG